VTKATRSVGGLQGLAVRWCGGGGVGACVVGSPSAQVPEPCVKLPNH